MEEFEARGSGWRYLSTNHLHVGINNVTIVAGSSFLKSPLWVSRKNAVINIVNFDDHYCFLYSVLASLFPAKSRPERPESYPKNFNDHFNLRGLEFPMKIHDIIKFEKLNPKISINVFGIKNESISGPLYITKEKKEHHIDLLLLTQGENSHYCLIKDLSRLLRSSVTKEHNKKYFCSTCLNHFPSKQRLDLHEQDCSIFKPVKIVMPEKENAFLQFSSHKAMLRRPIILTADFESMTVPIKDPLPTAKSSFFYEKHEPIAVGYSTICSFDSKYNTYQSHCSKDCVAWFIDQLKVEARKIHEILINEEIPSPSSLTHDQRKTYDSTSKCPVCQSDFTNENPKCFHHDHYNPDPGRWGGLPNGAICSSCNLKIQKDFSVPVFFHNLSGYDAHLFIRELSRHTSVSVIPSNTESYIAISAWFGKIKFIFLDSFRFLPTSLGQLVGNLSPEQLRITKSYFPDENQMRLLLRKQVFCYDYVSSEEKLLETHLPAKKLFFNQLTFEHISDADYRHAKTVWKVFGCENLRDYTMLYLKSDVLLLADVIENFRDLTLKHFSMDSAGFFTSPGLSWSAALKMTNVKLELLTCVDMFNFITKSIRGGLCNAIHRHSKANNVFMEGFDPNKEISYIHYLDFVNLYGYCLMEPLPVGDFRWLDDTEIEPVKKMLSGEGIQSSYKEYFKFQKNKNIILEVDLEYPDNLHDLHNQMPFCASHVKPENCSQSKLMCTLENKERYVIHFKNLVQCLQHGLRLTKIHRVLEFTEEAWLKPYIEFNTKLRAASKNEFEKNFFKLLINSIFGKTIESDRKKRDIKLASSWASARKLILKPNFLRSTIIDENFVIIEMSKTQILANKPVFCGYSILEFAKYKMYSFHYLYVIPNLSPFFKINLLYQDTDSQVYSFTLKENADKNLSFYDFMRRDALTNFDTSDFPENNVCNIPRVNSKVPGLMKDEVSFKIIKEFIALRPKVYSLVVGENILQNPDAVRGKEETVRKIKGVAKSASKQISFQDFYDCVFSNVSLKANFNTIRSRKHTLYSVNINKLALVNYDNKRHICDDQVSTLAFGNYRLRNNE